MDFEDPDAHGFVRVGNRDRSIGAHEPEREVIKALPVGSLGRLLGRISIFAGRLAMEPPLRLLTRAVVKRVRTSIRTKARWDVAHRPHYLLGVLRAADQARECGLSKVAVIEFGVAGGAGLLLLQEYAEQVERETGVKLYVYGFDTGVGLPQPSGDYRDHPELWIHGDYPMDHAALQKRLTSRTQLVLGQIAATVPKFVREQLQAPVGFIAIDVDLYTSARDALTILSLTNRKTLRRVVIYLDDAETMLFHRFAGELLAVEEFNQRNEKVKIDRWRGIKNIRPFPEHGWLDKMYVAYDLEAFGRISVQGRAKEVIDIDNIYGQVNETQRV